MTIKKIQGYRIFLDQRLGKGAYGSVYKGQTAKKEPCAVKVLDKSSINSDPYLKAALISQIKIMKALKSENIVGFMDVMESNNNYYIIQQLCTGDLDGYLKSKPGKRVSQQQGIRLLREICNGFVELVQQGVVHRDLKPANILMSNGMVKIGDFGFAKKNVTQKLKNQTSVGTPLYMSAQLLKGQPYTSKCDIWAIGFIFYQILHGCTPWTARSEFELVRNIQNKPLKIQANLSQVTKKFLQQALQVEEQKRITWDELFRHEIFEGYFKKYTQLSLHMENMYKKVIRDLRFKVNSQNINLKKLWQNLGYSQEKELNREQFSQFLRLINPNMASIQQHYFYQKMDANGDGLISLKQVQTEFEKYNIPLESVFGNKLPFMLKKLTSVEEDHDDIMNQQQGNKINSELEKKIQSCFNRLHLILTKKNLTLYKVYTTYDGDKSGQLSLVQFSKIIKRLDPSFTQDQLQAVFNLVDADSSKTIQFDQLNSYYCKIIGLPEALYISPKQQAEKIKKKTNYYHQKQLQQKQ